MLFSIVVSTPSALCTLLIFKPCLYILQQHSRFDLIKHIWRFLGVWDGRRTVNEPTLVLVFDLVLTKSCNFCSVAHSLQGYFREQLVSQSRLKVELQQCMCERESAVWLIKCSFGVVICTNTAKMMGCLSLTFMSYEIPERVVPQHELECVILQHNNSWYYWLFYQPTWYW